MPKCQTLTPLEVLIFLSLFPLLAVFLLKDLSSSHVNDLFFFFSFFISKNVKSKKGKLIYIYIYI